MFFQHKCTSINRSRKILFEKKRYKLYRVNIQYESFNRNIVCIRCLSSHNAHSCNGFVSLYLPETDKKQLERVEECDREEKNSICRCFFSFFFLELNV